MSFLIDGRPLQGPSAVRGIGSYVSGLLAGLDELGRASDVELLLSAGAPPPERALSGGVGIAPIRLPVLHPTLQPIADPVLVGRAVRRLRPWLYHGTEFGQPLAPPVPVVITVHDLIPFVFPADYPWVRRARLPALRLLRHASAVIAVSAATARDVRRLALVEAEKIAVVHNGISPAFHPPPHDEIAAMRRRLGLQDPYLLAVGTFDPRKRVHLLAEVARRIVGAGGPGLVIAGDQGSFAPTVLAALRAAGIEARTCVAGHVDETTLAALYSGAECLLFTSAYEGFGLPPLEAMACGTPAVLFDNSSLPEVGGPAALMVPDGDAAAMAGAVERLLGDPGERARRRDAGLGWAGQFTWKRAAEATLAVYERALRPERPHRGHV